MIDFLLTVAAVVVGFLIIGAFATWLPRKKQPMVCSFCGEEAWCAGDIVEHVKRCEKHPLKRELDGAVEHAKRLIEQREELKEVISPFAKQAEGIPDQWPGECVLTHNWLDDDMAHGAWLTYVPIVAQDGPTIADWRRLREVSKT